MNVKKIGMSLGILSMSALLSTKVFAFGMMEVENWQFQFSGNVNAFVVSTDCDTDGNEDVHGGLACGSGTASAPGNNDRATNIRTGLLPSWFGFRATRNTSGSNDFKTGVTLGFQPGVDDGGLEGNAAGNALGKNTVNFRQVFFDISKDSFGTIKIGRDLGLFGGDAILSDMTLLGIGTVSDLTKNGGNTSLGRIGVGYLYADWKAQLQYTSPDMNGLSFSVALVDPWQLAALGTNSLSSAGQKNDNFGYEGKINYTLDDNAKFWTGFIAQEIEVPGASYDATGFDVGAKFNVDALELVGYYYSGKGIGTTGFLLDGAAANGNRRDSDGYYLQATYKPAQTKFGVSYGESNLDLASNEVQNTLVKENKSTVIGVYHAFNDALTLVAEYTNTDSESHIGGSAQEQSFGIGGIMFF